MASPKKSFSISAAVSYGWKTVTKKLVFFILFLLIIYLVPSIPNFIAGLFDINFKNNFSLSLVIMIAGWIIQLVVSIGIINFTLKIYDKKKAVYADIFNRFNLIIPYFISAVVYTVIVIGGFILLIIPGIIWSIQFRYYPYFIVDRNMGPIEALKASSKLTKGVKWQLFFLGVVLALVNIVGFLCLIVGLFVTIPLTMMAEVYVFRKLQGK